MTTVPPGGTTFSTRSVRLSNSAATGSALCTVILIGLFAGACSVDGEKCLFLIVTLTAASCADAPKQRPNASRMPAVYFANRIAFSSKFIFEFRLADVAAEIDEVQMIARRFARMTAHL